MFYTAIRGLLPLFVAIGTSFVSFSAQAEDSKSAYFIDFLYLQDGKTAEDAKAYFSAIKPVIKRHGLVRVQAYVVAKTMKGDSEIDLINLWTISDTEGTFPKIGADPDYVKNIPVRNSTFDMSRTQMFILQAEPLE